MKYSFNWLKEFVEIKDKPEVLADILTLKTSEVEEIISEKEDTLFDIDVLPNRGDLLSHYGLARDISIIKNKKIKEFKSSFKELEDEEAGDLVKISIEEPKLCPRYSARVIKDIRVERSPKWLSDKLELIGLRPINNIVDVTNYVMLEIGQPLHAFDLKKVEGQSIKIRLAEEGEKIITLDESKKEIELKRRHLVIADSKRAIAIAGIKGGVGTEIDSFTKDIIIESANFDPISIRDTSRDLKIRTDASIRFSYGVDAELTTIALDRVVELLIEVAGGKVASGIVDDYPEKNKPVDVNINKEYLNSLIGVQMSLKTVKEILNLIFTKVEEDENQWKVLVPSYRSDIKVAEDVIEEVARVYGYDKIDSKAPVITAFSEHGMTDKNSEVTNLWDNHEKIIAANLIRDVLKSIGINETLNYSFVSSDVREIFKYDKIIELMNPISDNFKYLRPSLLPNLLKAVRNNLRYFDSFGIFELGRVFEKSDGASKENRELSGVYVIPSKSSEDIFFSLKGMIESFLRQIGLTDYLFSEGGLRLAFHPGKHALISVGDITIGEMGEANPKILSRMDISTKHKVAMFRFDLSKLIMEMREYNEYKPLPKYPSVVRDISAIVDTSVRINQLLDEINQIDDEDIIKDVDIFDIFEGSGIDNKKSVTFRIVYRSDDRTLKDSEVTKVEEKVKEALNKNLGAEVR